ncbi:MAG TPA: PaaI family thioesterase [Rhizomicrobium sp.]|nr:PaaI family thioesterase [Rhizomicrobium sp.]
MDEVPDGLPRDAENVSRGGFNLHAGPVWRLAADGELRRFALVIADKHMNGSGAVHGGLLMTFADVAMSQTSRAVSGAETCSTVSMTCDFVGPAKLGEILEARVRVTRQTRTMVFLSADIVTGDRPVAVATGLWKIA